MWFSFGVSSRGPMFLPASLTMQLHLCSLVPKDLFTFAIVSEVASLSLELNFNSFLVSVDI